MTSSALIAALAAAPAFAQAPPHAVKILVDPIDDTQFEHAVITGANGLGGFDSDGCTYSRGKQPRSAHLATSPTTLYSAPWESFDRKLDDEQKQALLRLLAGMGADVKDVRDLSLAQRYELAVAVARFFNESHFVVGDLLLEAAWNQRDTVVGFLPGLNGVGFTWQQVVELTPQATAVASPEGRTIATFDMARVCHRGGFPIERDDFLASLEHFPDAGMGAEDKRSEFLARVAVEEQLLARAREEYKQGLDKGLGTATERADYRWLVGDISRRLGQFDEAKMHLDAVLADGAASEETKVVVRDILAVLRVQGRQPTVPRLKARPSETPTPK